MSDKTEAVLAQAVHDAATKVGIEGMRKAFGFRENFRHLAGAIAKEMPDEWSVLRARASGDEGGRG